MAMIDDLNEAQRLLAKVQTELGSSPPPATVDRLLMESGSRLLQENGACILR